MEPTARVLVRAERALRNSGGNHQPLSSCMVRANYDACMARANYDACMARANYDACMARANFDA